MRADEYSKFDATELARLIRTREVAAVDVQIAAHIALGSVHDRCNTMVSGPWEVPLEYATDGHFAGVPFVLKDLGAHAAGIPARFGSRLSGAGVPYAHESFLVEKFRNAGFAIMGTTTTPEFGLCISSEALAYGPTKNPWDTTRSSGGSSGGTAAAVAAGGVPAGHGNDGGGSIRIPAAYTGLVGLKTSRGRVSTGPDQQHLAGGMAVEGVLTKSVRDCAKIFDLVSGYMPGDAARIAGFERPLAEELRHDSGPLRIAVHVDSWSSTGSVDSQVKAAVLQVANVLAGMGHQVEFAAPRCDEDELIPTSTTLFASGVTETVSYLAGESGLRPGPDTLEVVARSFYELGRNISSLQLAQAAASVYRMSVDTAKFFEDWDLLLTPTTESPAPALGVLNANDSRFDAESWSRFNFAHSSFTPLFNLAGTPAISLPTGVSTDGLPIGIQFASGMGKEGLLIRVSSEIERALPWSDRKPETV